MHIQLRPSGSQHYGFSTGNHHINCNVIKLLRVTKAIVSLGFIDSCNYHVSKLNFFLSITKKHYTLIQLKGTYYNKQRKQGKLK